MALRCFQAALLLAQFLIMTVKCDFATLQACGSQRNCWKQLDHEIIDNIRASIRNETQPCDNFWYHACGAWQPPFGTQHVDNFGIAIEQYERKLEALIKTHFQMEINNRIAAQSTSDLLSKIETYHSSCQQTAIEAKYYLAEFEKIEALNWPVWRAGMQRKTTAKATSDFNWLVLIAELRRFGLNNVIFRERATMAYNDARKYAIELGMPAENERFLKKHELVNYFIEFGLADGVTDQLWDLAAEIFDLETQLKALSDKRSSADDDDDDAVGTFEMCLSLNELKLKIPNIDWQLYFNVLLKQPHVDGALKIEMSDIGYFREVATLLAQSDERIVGFYVLLHLCKYLLEIRPRKHANHCVDHMNVVMPLGMNFIYKSFRYATFQEDEAALLKIFESLKVQFSKYIAKNKLQLNAQQKRYLQEKADKMTLRLGNLPRKVDFDYFNRYYDAVNVTADNFYQNHLALLRFRFEQQHSGLVNNSKELDMDTFYVYDDIVQLRSAPYFVHELNLLLVPMVFMQLPFFHHSLHALLQQSLLGFILGHEFNHAFEYEGIVMDALGNENPIGFDIRQQAAYQAGVKCFQQTATQSLIERMADVNGFQLAFDAYFDADGDDDDDVKKNIIVEDVGMNGGSSGSKFACFENFTAQHLFFLNFAQFFCGQLPEPIAHDRDDVRVKEIVKNMPEFLSLFQCALVGRDQPKYELCQMWR